MYKWCTSATPLAAVLVSGAIRRGLSRPRLASPGPANTIGPFVGWDFLELAVYGGDEGTEVLVAEGVGYEDAARMGPPCFDLGGQEREEVGDVGGDEHPVLGDGEFEYVIVSETFEILLGVEGPDVMSTIP